MESLSPEIILNICTYLTPLHLCRLSKVNKIYHDVTNDDTIWYSHVIHTFPGIYIDKPQKYKEEFCKQWKHKLQLIKNEHNEQIYHNMTSYFRLTIETITVLIGLYIVLYILSRLFHIFILIYTYILTYIVHVMLPVICLLLILYVIKSKCALYYELRQVKTQLSI